MQSSPKNKVAFVMPWFGEKISGGAEAEARSLMEHLKKHFLIEVLTTCVKDFHSDWNDNFWKKGEYEEMCVKVRRFKVRKRDTMAFDRVNAKLMQGQEVSEEEERLYIKESVRSEGLNEYIENNSSDYQWIFFIPYMFGTTYDGIKVAGDKAVLIPCLHDESYAYLGIYREMIENCRKVFLHVAAEKRLAERIFGVSKKFVIVGEGVNTDLTFERDAFKEKYGLGDFILCAGRKDSTKNTPQLVEYFDRYQKEVGANISLVLIGSGEISLPENQHILDLGFVSKEDKYNAMADALFLCNPSKNESFSIVLMESFLCERPVVVPGDCAVTKDHVLWSNAGLYYDDYDTFFECVQYFVHNGDAASEMGKNGRKYVLKNYNWDQVIENYLKEL